MSTDRGMSEIMSGATPSGWAKPIENELSDILESLDLARLAIAARLKDEGKPGSELGLFSEKFDSAISGLQRLLLDALSPKIADGLDELRLSGPF